MELNRLQKYLDALKIQGDMIRQGISIPEYDRYTESIKVELKGSDIRLALDSLGGDRISLKHGIK